VRDVGPGDRRACSGSSPASPRFARGDDPAGFTALKSERSGLVPITDLVAGVSGQIRRRLHILGIVIGDRCTGRELDDVAAEAALAGRMAMLVSIHRITRGNNPSRVLLL
jgi:hypothetical protein